MSNKRYNWDEIQEFYDKGNSWRDITKHFGVTQKAVLGAKNRGDFTPTRSLSDAQKISRKKYPWTHSDGSKANLRKHMLRRLKEGTYPTLGRNFRGRTKSYPEIWWKTVFADRLENTNFVDELQFGIYSLDYAWPELKKCIEIDGAQHEEENQKDSDLRKDAYLLSEGWQVLRMPWKATLADKETAILRAKEFIDAL